MSPSTDYQEESAHHTGPAESPQQAILASLKTVLARLLHSAPAEIEAAMPLLEMGADSLVIAQAVRQIEERFGLSFTTRQLFEELNTLEALAAYIAAHSSQGAFEDRLPAVSVAPARPVKAVHETTAAAQRTTPTATVWQPHEAMAANGHGATPGSALERVISQQIQVMAQQLEVLRGRGRPMPEPVLPEAEAEAGRRAAPRQQRLESPPERQVTAPPQPASPAPRSALPPWRVTEVRARGLRPEQQRHLEDLIKRYTAKTPQSKQLTQRYRPVLADSRASAGFRLSTKEMLYPIFGDRARGARTWDIDGNEYIDLTMGFGVNLFGHYPPFVAEALQQQLEKTMQLGLQTPLAGEAAALVSELTGMQRVTFCNSGTEAVMTALRLARTATGRHKVVTFAMSYHGHFDGTLGEAQMRHGQPHTAPAAPGIAPSMVADLMVLEYGTPEALDIIRAHAHELAAVLVEPIQSRRPDFQPREFLQQLRQLTLQENIPLIFDEMITGFRVHPGGAQAWFGIQADLATYGKIVGGGMPIGIIAGKAAYMDGIDGGVWDYGDGSYPQANTTLFAGTFCKHPLAMAAACAVLREIKTQGLPIYERLNQRTAQVARTLNDYFGQEDMPLQIVHCASLFRFSYSSNLDLLYYHLLDKGVYIWEGRNCFLSTAHTDADIAYVITATQESLEALRQGGFLPRSAPQGEKKKTLHDNPSQLATTAKAMLAWAPQSLPEYLLRPRQVVQRLQPYVKAWWQQPGLEEYRDVFVALPGVCVAYVVNAFRDMGWPFSPGQRFATESIARQLGIDYQYQKLLGRLLEMFTEEGWLRHADEQWEVVQSPTAPDASALREHMQALLQKCPAATAELTLLERCASSLADVLQGRIEPLQLLFPAGDTRLITQVYQQSPGAQCLNTLLQKVVTEALANLPPGRRARLLEIGAGTGGTTACVLPHLPAEHTDYVFTDITPGFLWHARSTLQAYPFVHYQVLDIEQPPEGQHFAQQRFDIVIAANVLHATRDLRQAVQHIQQLLMPGGLLVLLEGTTKQRWLDLIFGLTDGWWRFTDHHLRPSYPLLTTVQWQKFLSANGFNDVVGLAPRSASAEHEDIFSQQVVIVAQHTAPPGG